MWTIITHMKTNIELKIIKATCIPNNLAWEDRNKESLQSQLIISTTGIIITSPRILIYIIHLIIINRCCHRSVLSSGWIPIIIIIIRRIWPILMYQMMVPNQLVQWAWREQNKNSLEGDTIISIIIKMKTSIV